MEGLSRLSTTLREGRPRTRSTDRLGDVAFERIRAELLSKGEAAFGGRLVENQIADQLSLSRTPVREALQRLRIRGWLDEVPGGGFRVRRSSIREVLDVFEIRLLLEPLAALLAATDPAVHVPDPPAASGLSFHLELADLCRVTTLQNAIVEVSQACVLSRAGGATTDFGADHRVIAAAVNGGDGTAAHAAMVEHLVRVRQDRLRNFGGTDGRP